MNTVKLGPHTFRFLSFNDILEHILKNKEQKQPAAQIISLNSENLVSLENSNEFKKVVLTSYGVIADGVGVVAAGRWLAGARLKRLSGVDVMDKLLREASKYRLRCLLIGGDGQLAEQVVNCYKQADSQLIIGSTRGFADLKQPSADEIKALWQIVRTIKPHLVFVAFGSPQQELWINQQKELFRGATVMGVGGAFAMLSGALLRAPYWMRKLGLEWLFRLIQQPWRARRQLKLLQFVYYIILWKLKGHD